jgi:hypothetical protein
MRLTRLTPAVQASPASARLLVYVHPAPVPGSIKKRTCVQFIPGRSLEMMPNGQRDAVLPAFITMHPSEGQSQVRIKVK